MKEETKANKSLPLWRRIALGLIVLAMIALAAVMLAGYLIKTRLNNTIAGIHKAGYPVSFEQLMPTLEVDASDDAAVLYASALSNLPATDLKGLTRILAVYRNAVDTGALDKLPGELQPGIASVLNQHRSFLSVLDTAAGLPLAHFDIGINRGGDACIQSLDQIQTALMLQSLRTTFLMGAKQYDFAAKSIITMLKASRVFDTTPTVLVSRIRLHYIRLACDDIRLLLSHGRPSDAILHELGTALAGILGGDAIKHSLLAEQVFQIEVSRNFISEKLAADILSQEVPDLPERARLPGTMLGKMKLRWFMLQYFDTMGDLIKASSKSSPELLAYVLDQKESRSGNLNRVIGPVYSTVENAIETTAFVRISSLAVQIETYRRAHGNLPDSLQAISESVVPEVMTDPCSGKQLLYASNDQSYTLYSTGLDGIDHGGAIQSQISQTTGQIEKESDDIGFRILIPKE
jgi:hypothetical protein